MFYVYWAELVEHLEGTGYIPTGQKSGQNLNIKIRSKAMPDSFQVVTPLFHLFDDPSNIPPSLLLRAQVNALGMEDMRAI